MSKRLIAGITAALLLLSLCACRSVQTDNTPAGASSGAPQVTAAQSTAAQTTTTQTTTVQSSAESSAAAQKPMEPIFTAGEYPRVDGSTVTIPLSEAFYCRTVGATEEEARLNIKHNKTHTAYINLCNGDADIIFVTYPSAEELQLVQDAGTEYEIVPIVKDAFIFLVNANNPVDALTVSQIQEIYMGVKTDWSQVGGTSGGMIAYQRPVNSGSQSGMLELVMKQYTMMDAPTEMRPAEMGSLIEAISSYDNAERAIGYSYYYYARLMYNRENTKYIAVDGIEPNDETIQSGEYPFTTAYYAVMRKDTPADAPARKLLAWILSSDGQNTAKEASYVPVS